MNDGLIITIGCPGAGKSTWAGGLPNDCLRLERDRFREAIFGSRRAYHESPIDRSTRSAVITNAMGAAMVHWPYRKFAVTDTGLIYRAVSPFMETATQMGLPITVAIFDVPWETLVERNKTRDPEHRIPDDILESCYADFMAEDAWWKGPTIKRYYPRLKRFKAKATI